MSKKRRVSKKTKRSWRKDTDVKDVENFLEDQRQEERIGAIETFKNSELFVIDKKPSHKKHKEISKKVRRAIVTNSKPKCFTLLQPLTRVPDPIKRRNRVRTPEERRDTVTKNIEERKRLQGIVKAKDKVRQQNRTLHELKKNAETYKIGDYNHDIWEVEDVSSNQWINPMTKLHNGAKTGLKQVFKKAPSMGVRKQTVTQAIDTPHPGISYNPSLKDHQDLLSDVLRKEQEIIKQEKHLERVTSRMFCKTTLALKEASWIVEMSEGLPKNSIKTPENNSDSETEFKSINPPVKNVKKDPKQRRKQKEQREIKRKLFIQKQEKKKIADIYHLKNIKSTIAKTDAKIEKLREKREKVKQYKKLEPKRLCPKKYEEPDLVFNVPTEISGNLRNLTVSGSLLKDRFKSLQKRSILEPRVQQGKKKRAKMKKYEPGTHKMGWESKGF